MLLIKRWLSDLTRAIENEAALRASHHRVVEPGSRPLAGPGLVRHQPVGPVARPGQPPEYMSVMGFFVPTGTDYGMNNVELARSLGAQLTYLLDRRIDVLTELPIAMEGKPEDLTFLPISGVPDRALLAPIETDYESIDDLLRRSLALLAGMDDGDAEVVAAALDMHYGACLLLDRDIASAYTLLVAGIETMSRRFGSPPQNWSDWDQARRWEAFSTDAGLDEDQVGKLQSALMMDRQLRLNETFATYASERLPDSFWEADWRDWLYTLTMPTGVFTGGEWSTRPVAELVPQDRLELKRALKRTYVARSGFVHSGDRTVDLQGEMLAQAAPDRVQRLSFPALRLVLKALIEVELQERTTSPFSMPELVFTLNAWTEVEVVDPPRGGGLSSLKPKKQTARGKKRPRRRR